MKRYAVMTSTHTSECADGPFLLANDVHTSIMSWLDVLCQIVDETDPPPPEDHLIYVVIKDMTAMLPAEGEDAEPCRTS